MFPGNVVQQHRSQISALSVILVSSQAIYLKQRWLMCSSLKRTIQKYHKYPWSWFIEKQIILYVNKLGGKVLCFTRQASLTGLKHDTCAGSALDVCVSSPQVNTVTNRNPFALILSVLIHWLTLLEVERLQTVANSNIPQRPHSRNHELYFFI